MQAINTGIAKSRYDVKSLALDLAGKKEGMMVTRLPQATPPAGLPVIHHPDQEG
jgi:hypothetical protein